MTLKVVKKKKVRLLLHLLFPILNLKKGKIVCLNNFSKVEENSDSDESELIDESLSEAYKQMYESWVKVCSENRSLVKKNKELSFEIKQLTSLNEDFEKEITSKNVEINKLSKDLDTLEKNVRMLNPRSTIFEDIQNAGQKGHVGLGASSSQKPKKTVFISAGMLSPDVAVPSALKSVATSSRSVSIKETQTVGKCKGKNEKFIPTCHFCGRKGHIRPRCFTLMNFAKNEFFEKLNYFDNGKRAKREKAQPKKMWIEKKKLSHEGTVSDLPKLGKVFDDECN